MLAVVKPRELAVYWQLEGAPYLTRWGATSRRSLDLEIPVEACRPHSFCSSPALHFPDGPVDLSSGIAFAERCALVVQFLASPEADLELCTPTFKV